MSRRIGEISAELDEAPGKRTDKPLATNGKRLPTPKAEVLKRAGISTSAAHRAEKLVANTERVLPGRLPRDVQIPLALDAWPEKSLTFARAAADIAAPGIKNQVSFSVVHPRYTGLEPSAADLHGGPQP